MQKAAAMQGRVPTPRDKSMVRSDHSDVAVMVGETPRRRMQKAAAMQGGVPTYATNRWSDRTTQLSRL
jgi:hypothetical protein